MTYINRVFLGSCENMNQIPDGVVHTCVTSPPYYGLRDYGIDGQIGLEETLDEYVARLVQVFREVRRVLRADGTLWLNLGDSYASTPVSSFNGGGFKDGSKGRDMSGVATSGVANKLKGSGLKPKDLLGVPWRVAFALQADGWWLRDAIVWHKPACMPSSVSDRCTPCYELIFMLAKSERYYADMASVKTPLKVPEAKGMKFGGNKADGYGNPAYSGNVYDAEDLPGANLRNVWTIATEPYAGAHFAVFPRELAARCIRIGSPENGIVLDPFMGSGTTAEVAESLGRHWVGYELNPAYHKLIAERTAQRNLFKGGAA